MKRLIFSLAVGAVTLLVGTLSAQVVQVQPGAASTLRGKIVRTEGNNRVVVRTVDNKEVILTSSPTTKYVVNGKAGAFADLRTGTSIDVGYVVQGGNYIANSFQVAETTAAPPDNNTTNRKIFRGRVVRVNEPNNQVIVVGPDNKEVVLYVQKNGRFMRNGQPIKLTELQVNTPIETYYVDRDNQYWVEEISVVTQSTGTEPAPPAEGSLVEGVVVRVVGQNQVVIRTADKKEVIIELAPQTVYLQDNQPYKLQDIQTGQELRVQYNVRDRRSIANRIFVNRRK